MSDPMDPPTPQPPPVAPLDAEAAGPARPLWSVMIPTYEPSALLEATLRAVLDQDPGPGAMQIAVVDDRSPTADVEGVVRRLDPAGRVEFHRQPRNVGLAGNWNGCIDRARGHLVHILHQDDLVAPGFYDRLGRAARARPDAGAFLCRHEFIDAAGERTGVSDPERDGPGLIDGWLDRIAVRQRVMCPAIAVRREVYEAVGGFRDDLRYVLDWEMWVRIAARYPFWYEPEVLASYRSHPENETSRLRRGGADLADYAKGLGIIARHLPAARREELTRAAARQYGLVLEARAAALMRAGDRRAGMALVRDACRFHPAMRRDGMLLRYRKWQIKLLLRGLLTAAVGRP